MGKKSHASMRKHNMQLPVIECSLKQQKIVALSSIQHAARNAKMIYAEAQN